MALAMVALVLCLPAWGQGPTDAIKVDLNFTHDFTSFPLEGAHIAVPCETCHEGAIFKGVPTTCFGCHNGDMAKGKTEKHPQTSNACGDCHNQQTWTGVHVDHGTITANCFSCHDGKTATGKSKLHVKSAEECETCHNVVSWNISRFDHTQTTETCESCHDGQQAMGKPYDHVRSANACGNCHKSVDWTIGVFNHEGIVDGCFSCHDGVQANGKSRNHLDTSNVCEACHTPVGWSVISFDHTQTGVRSCIDCHDGRSATGRASAHFKTTNDCGSCHTTLVWKPATFDHALTLDVTNCFSCHNGNRPPADGKSRNHIKSSNVCTDCHADNNFSTWAGARFKHGNTVTGCFDCHNNTTATGKPDTHVTTTNVCESCHITSTFVDWKTSRFDHNETTGKPCASCHDGNHSISSGPIVGKTQGPHGRHLPTTDTCESCHNTTSYIPAKVFDHNQMTVSTCFTCHNGTETISKGKLTSKTKNHIVSGNDCESCHTTVTWASAVFDHSNIGTARCDSCHDGQTAQGLSKNHFALLSNPDCGDCHATVAWTSVTFDHQFVSGACLTCHNGSTATSKGLLTSKDPLTHIPTDQPCETCHTAGSPWKIAFDHSNTNGAECSSCHDGLHSVGKSRSHISSTNACQDCHTTAGWVPSQMDHAAATGTCYSCHDGTHSIRRGVITARPSTHYSTSNACTNCHETTTWKPAKSPFDHSQALGTCFSCHDGNHLPAEGRSGTHVISSTDCAECHTSTGWRPAAFSHLDTTVASTPCENCHAGQVSGATPKSKTHPLTSDTCNNCHTTAGFTPARMDHDDPQVVNQTCVNCHAQDKPANHTAPEQQADCASCHSTVNWATNGKPDHSGFTSNCVDCHNGKTTARGKPGSHFTTSDRCESCHNTNLFAPAQFDHGETSITTCISCHDGAPKHAPALGKSAAPKHPLTSNTCDNCHAVGTSWAGAVFRHDDPVVLSATCFSCHDGNHAPADGRSQSHLSTTTYCEACHSSNVPWTSAKRPFDHAEAVGTCFSCHDGNKVAGKGSGHLQTGNTCDDCHVTTTWTTVTFDHSALGGTSCFTCHNGTKATGKGPTHFATGTGCDDCHTTDGWSPARFEHGSALSLNNCFSCHDGKHAPAGGKSLTHVASSNDCVLCHDAPPAPWTTARLAHDDPVVASKTCSTCHDGAHNGITGKSEKHFKTLNDCALCHGSTSDWFANVVFEHSQAIGTCFSCHDGNHAPAEPKGQNHFTTTNSCDSCHVTTAWTTNVFDHSQTSAPCLSCHDGSHSTSSGPVASKGPKHFITTQPCEICHTTSAWSPVLAYTHVSPAYENHGSNTPTCLSCHKQNNEKITFARPDLAPDCAACHASRFKPDSHKKYTSPTTKLYTVDELRDCTGACHTYADQTLATIKTRRAGPEHRATKGSW